MVHVVYSCKAEPLVSGKLLDVLQMVTSRTRILPGCLQSDIWTKEEQNAFMVYEVWSSRKDLDSHISSFLYRSLLVAFEMCSEKPDIRFCECENVQGFEKVEALLLEDNNPEK